jgi:hypothetical protein
MLVTGWCVVKWNSAATYSHDTRAGAAVFRSVGKRVCLLLSGVSGGLCGLSSTERELTRPVGAPFGKRINAEPRGGGEGTVSGVSVGMAWGIVVEPGHAVHVLSAL